MKALQIDRDDLGKSRWLQSTRIGSDDAHDEAWVRDLIFAMPDLVPMQEIDPGVETWIPLCKELPIPRPGSRAILLDLLGVTPAGRLVLIECKLWRNPQARREVIGQILEYAALLQSWSYGDLTVQLARRLDPTSEARTKNLLFDHVTRSQPGLDEARFVDGVSHSLGRGDFDLIVAGDGIRSDVKAIASFLHGSSGIASRIALLELQIWRASDGGETVVPVIPFRTEVVEHRVVVGSDGVPVTLGPASAATEDEVESEIEPEEAAARAAEQDENRRFWQEFMDGLRLEHPDQPPPRHGSRNYITLPFPDPAERLVVYRTKPGDAGIYFRLRSEEGQRCFDELRNDADALEADSGLELAFRERQFTPTDAIRWTVACSRQFDPTSPDRDDMQRKWLVKALNAFVSTFRPRLSAWSS